MPVQAPQWTEFLSCPICYNVFNETLHRPISLGCGHTVCKSCLAKLHQKKCPFDQNVIQRELDELPVNFALLQLVGVAVPESAEVPKTSVSESLAENYQYYNSAKRCIEELAIYLKPVPPSSSSSSQGAAAAAAAASEASTSGANPVLSRPMQRKLVSLVNCQLVEEEGRARVMRAARSLGERTVTELILQHQNPQQLSANLWAAVRARGCQFLGPAMQEEVLKLILLALEDGSALSRKVLVLFVVQRLENQYPQASKTAIGHVVQLLYRASCFKVTKRDEESSLMQLKEEFRSYEALRREHDSQIVQIATEAGLRISPEQWSSLLYGDTAHKSHMQSIIDKLQTPQSFAQSVNELLIALQRSGDAGNLSRLRPHFDLLSNIDPSPDTPPPSWENLDAVLMSVQTCVEGLVEFVNTRTNRKTEPMPTHNLKFKTSMCRDLEQRGSCPRGTNCTFAHTAEEMERFRARSKKFGRTQQPVSMLPGTRKAPTSSALTAREREELALVTRSTDAKLQALMVTDSMQARPSSHTSVSSSFRASSNSVVSSVTVPVVKPYSLPLQAKSNISQQTIYTSPTQTREEQQPVIIPISHKAPSLMGRQAPEGGQGEVAAAHSGSLSSPRPGTAILSGSSGHKPEMTTTTHLSQVYKNTMMMGAMTTRATAPAPWQKTPSQVAEVIHRPNLQSAMAHMLPPVDDSFMKHTISLPPNPYTTDKNLPTNDSHYYMATNVAFATRGKSTTEQLGELHRRRRELLVQLNKTQEDSMKTSTNSELSMSVADSFAACRSTMSLANYSQQEEAAYYEDWSGGGDVSADMEGYTQFMDEANLYEEPPPQFGEDLMRGCQDNSSSSHSRPASINRPSPAPSPWSLDGDIGRLDDFGDEFIPFPEHSQVSKYGPISRMSKVKMKNTIPVQVTAAQPKETTPVTAVTPMSRPYPMSFHVSSKYDLKHKGAVMSNFPTLGATVATSLPTALLQPNIIATASPAKKEGQNLWTLREKILNLPGLDKPAAKSTAEREQIRHELARLNTHIENLEISEDERMARELQAIELNIQETERQLSIDEEFTEKEKQVIEDRKLAGQIALSEARRLARPPASNKKFGVDRK